MDKTNNKKYFYITTPIFYPNAKLHLGHAFTTTICDAYARYHRLMGKEVYFLTGNDEHATKVERSAQEAEKAPKVFVDEMAVNVKSLYERLYISYDDFIQTSDKKRHWPGAQQIWQKLIDRGDIEKRSYRGLYCVACESFKTEKDLSEDGLCPDHDTKPEWLEEENYFFTLSKYTDQIKEIIQSDKIEVIPQARKNEILSFLNQGLEDVSFSRPKSNGGWGIPVPGDDSQVMYVWCDALVNYISALGYGLSDTTHFEKFWPVDLHVVGKDILRFHAAIWPAMLIAADVPLPKRILAHGFINSSGRKMSKTIGNTIDPEQLINEYGGDAVRYYLLREVNTFEDSEITYEKFKEAYNANLANGLGNLVNRILKLAEDHLEGAPEIPDGLIPQDFKDAFDAYDYHKAIEFVWGRIGDLDQEIQKKQPFKLVKTDKEAAVEMIKELVIKLYTIANMLHPFLPDTSVKIKATIRANKKPEIPLFARKD